LHVTAILAQERRDMLNAPETGLRRRIAIALLLASATPAAIAQYPTGATVQPLPRGDDPAERLAQALRTLAVEPNNVQALTAAGQNALILGDPNAAVGFLGRAGALAPRDGRVKAGLGSALVQLEKPQDALRLFSQATALGVPDADIAEDRGLAYDLIGDGTRAQRDYATVLANDPNDDTARRRLALSQGIAGDRKAAIATLDPLIRKRDIAGWRAQTFVLAMTGDTKGASEITHIMLPSQADMLQPFLMRLASLSAADKARAVHFGEMPATGRPYTAGQLANIGTPATYAATASAPTHAPAPRRAPKVETHVETRPETRVASVQPSDLAPVVSRPAVSPPVQAPATPPPRETAAPLAGIALAPVAAAPRAVEPVQAVQPARAIAGPPADMATVAPAPAPAPVATPAAPPSITTVALPPSTPATTPPVAASAPATVPPMPQAPAAGVGHYDLPHDAAARAPVRPIVRPVPSPAPVQVARARTEYLPDTSLNAVSIDKPIGARPKTEDVAVKPAPKTVIARADATAPVRTTRAGKSLDRAEPADDGATEKTATARGRHKPVADDEADTRTERTTRGKGKASKADATDEADSGTSAKSGKSGRSGKDVAADTDSSTKSAKGRRGKADTADDADRTEKTGRTGKGGKADKSSSASTREKPAAERVYVQVAGGANKADMDKAWDGVKKKAPDLMKGRTPSTTPLRATNRLLVGPFKSDDEAQAFVNKMAGKGLSGFVFKSSRGQKVDKVDSGQ
jgi:Flp pilus assembly protein TadD